METNNTYNVLIADDHKLVRDCVKKYLENDAEIKVVACVENGKLAVDMCKLHKIDVVLMDMVMPECDGITASKEIVALNKNIKILILTSIPDGSKLIEATKCGVSGFITKDSSASDMILSIKNAANGKMVFEKSVFDGIINKIEDVKKPSVNIFSDLSEVELLVLKILSNEGLDNKEIAKKAFISESTVRSILSKLMKKYGISKRTQLVLFALKNGLA